MNPTVKISFPLLTLFDVSLKIGERRTVRTGIAPAFLRLLKVERNECVRRTEMALAPEHPLLRTMKDSQLWRRASSSDQRIRVDTPAIFLITLIYLPPYLRRFHLQSLLEYCYNRHGEISQAKRTRLQRLYCVHRGLHYRDREGAAVGIALVIRLKEEEIPCISSLLCCCIALLVKCGTVSCSSCLATEQ